MSKAKKFNCKNPEAAPTSKQTWAVKCMTGEDIRKADLTREEVSRMIGDLKSKGDHFLSEGKTYFSRFDEDTNFICTKAAMKEVGARLWEKAGKVNPLAATVGAVVKSKARKKSTPRISTAWAEELCREAAAKGEESLKVLIDSNAVEPMVVQERADVMDDSSPVKEEWIVPGGPCGFASIRVKCTNGPSRKFINQLKKAGLAGDQNSFKEWSQSDYYGGYMKSFTMIGGQSLAYKTAYAYGFESVLAKAGIDTWIWTRMD